MKQTFRLEVSKHGGFLVGGIDYDKWCNVWEEGFRGQEVTITVETIEKPKVQMCEAGCGCDKAVQWELWNQCTGARSYCSEHVWRGFNSDEGTDYTITPIKPTPELPELIVAEREDDFRHGCFTVRFEKNGNARLLLT